MTDPARSGPGGTPAWARAGSLPWLVAGAIGWAGLLWIGWTLWQPTPPNAGFDLRLLLDGARAVTAGHSPYDPAMLAGAAPAAADLFYSYPPPVAQAMTLLAWLPDGFVLLLWGAGATAGLAAIAAAIGRGAGLSPGSTALRTVSVAPLVLPFAVALLFGNLDAWFPLACGGLVLAALPGASPRTRLLAGVAAALITIAKLHPAPLLAWVAARVVADRGGPQARVLAAAAVTGVAVVIVSLIVGGSGPWQDYIAVVRAGAGAGLVDPRNLGPVSLLGQVMHLDPSALRLVAVAIAVASLGVAALVGLRVRDPLASLTIAIAASLVTLPVTWYHYPVALLPVGVVLAVRHPATRPWLALAVVTADLAIGVAPLLWVAVAILIVVAWGVARRPAPVRVPA